MDADELKGSLGPPIAYYRTFAHVGGGVVPAVFLSQCLYWTTTLPDRRDGWFYKSRKEWTDETGLTRDEQQTARRLLREAGILQERQANDKDRRLWFRLDLDVLAAKIAGLSAPQTVPEME